MSDILSPSLNDSKESKIPLTSIENAFSEVSHHAGEASSAQVLSQTMIGNVRLN